MNTEPMSAAELLAVIDRAISAHDSAPHSHIYTDREELADARTAVSAMAEREAALVAERDGYKSGWWDVVEMLGGKKLPDISNAQYHASVLAPKIRDLIALSAERDALRAEVEALRADAERFIWQVTEWCKPQVPANMAVIESYKTGDINAVRDAIDAARAEAGHG